jgi:putative acetyltransferase
MPTIIAPESPDTADARALISELDVYLEPLYPIESRHGFSIEKLLRDEVSFFVVRHEGTPAGCCGIKLFGTEYGEIKRMYVRPQFRGLGFGKLMLNYLESYARSKRITLLRLETGIYQPEALGLYERMGYYVIPPFGPYTDDPLSRCYEKPIS